MNRKYGKRAISPGTIIENVEIVDGKPNFNSSLYTENGRASYSTSSIQNADLAGYIEEHPKNIIMLTCDAFGVLPARIKTIA